VSLAERIFRFAAAALITQKHSAVIAQTPFNSCHLARLLKVFVEQRRSGCAAATGRRACALEKPLGFIAGATQEQAKRANLAGNISLI
jgi:hypothetical protein